MSWSGCMMRDLLAVLKDPQTARVDENGNPTVFLASSYTDVEMYICTQCGKELYDWSSAKEHGGGDEE